jgi:hypothetical protein
MIEIPLSRKRNLSHNYYIKYWAFINLLIKCNFDPNELPTDHNKPCGKVAQYLHKEYLYI